MRFEVTSITKLGESEIHTRVEFGDVEVDRDDLADFVEDLKHAIEGKTMQAEIQRAWVDRRDMATKKYVAEKRIAELEAENEQIRQGNEDLQRRCRELEKIVEREAPTGQKD